MKIKYGMSFFKKDEINRTEYEIIHDAYGSWRIKNRDNVFSLKDMDERVITSMLFVSHGSMEVLFNLLTETIFHMFIDIENID